MASRSARSAQHFTSARCGPVGPERVGNAVQYDHWRMATEAPTAPPLRDRDSIPERFAMARALGVDHTVDFKQGDPVKTIMALTDGRGVDVAIEALGTQATFEGALRVLRPGGTLSSLGVYSSDLRIPLDSFAAGLGDTRIVTTLCPGGKERMRRLMDVVASGRVDLRRMVTHRFTLDRIEEAYELFSHQRDGVLKVAITI